MQFVKHDPLLYLELPLVFSHSADDIATLDGLGWVAMVL